MLRHDVSDVVTANFQQVPYLVIVFLPLNPAEFALNSETVFGRRIFPRIKNWHIAIPQYIYTVAFDT